MNCFVCSHDSDPHQNQGFFIVDSTAKFTGRDIATAIYHLVGNAFIVTIHDRDVICKTFASLISELDRFHFETRALKQILKRQIHRNYELGQINQLLDIDGAAILSFNINSNNGKHKCKTCSHAVDYLDQIAAHYRYHHLAESCLSGNKIQSVLVKNEVYAEELKTEVQAPCDDELESPIQDETFKGNAPFYDDYTRDKDTDSPATIPYQYSDDYDNAANETSTCSKTEEVIEEANQCSIDQITEDVFKDKFDLIQSDSPFQSHDALENVLKASLPLCLLTKDMVQNKTKASLPTPKIRYKCTKCLYVSTISEF